MGDPEDWWRLLREQENTVSRAQALAQGLTDEVIDAHLDAGRWQRLFHGVLAVTTGPPTASMWRRAALLFARGPAMLSHATAAAMWGLPGAEEDGPIHLTVPYGSSARGCAGIEVHRSRAFAYIGSPGSDPPVTSKVATLVDVAVHAPSAREAMRLLTAGAAVKRIPAVRVLEALERRRPRRYRRPLEDAARLLHEGVESVLEAEYVVSVERAHGLPAPTRQAPVSVDDHRRAEDNLYRAPRGELVVRIDGWRYHANRRTAFVDRARDNAAELAGRARLTFGHEEIRGDPCRTARTIARRLGSLGWDGEPRRCARCAREQKSVS